MKTYTIHLLRIIMILLCFAYSHKGMSQNSTKSWKEELEYAIQNSNKNSNDSIHLSLIKYTHKGIIDSEALKLDIINQLLSEDAPTVLNYPPVVTKDTITTDSSCVIKEKHYPIFKIISISEMREIVKSAGLEDPTIPFKEKLREIIKIGNEYLELEWNFNNKKIKSLCVVSNGNGSIIYEPIGFSIITERTITTSESWKEVNNNETKQSAIITNISD